MGSEWSGLREREREKGGVHEEIDLTRVAGRDESWVSRGLEIHFFFPLSVSLSLCLVASSSARPYDG